jgi:glycosyltransferase involved in cell wall biosynthesis
MAMKNNYDEKLSFVCFGGVDWWYHYHAHIDPQIIKHFTELGRTLYINSIVMKKFNFGKDKRFFHRLVRKTKSIFTGLKKTEKGFWVYSPFSLPVHHIWWAKPLNYLLLRFQVWRVTRKLGISNPVVLVACPAACDVALKMKKRKLMYQRTDRFEEELGVDVDTIVKYDQKLKAGADLTYYASRELYDTEYKQCRNAFYLNHGVDFELFASEEAGNNVPQEMAEIPKPIIGYFGSTNPQSFNISLAEKIADFLPEKSFVYIGAISPECAALKAKSNVWMLGKKDYEQIPRYGKCFDLAILPWNRNRWTEAANPIKVKEYLALGKPFVCTPVFTQIKQYLDVTYRAETPKEFAMCINKALKEDNPDRVAARRKKVQPDTWARKAQELLDELFG